MKAVHHFDGTRKGSCFVCSFALRWRCKTENLIFFSFLRIKLKLEITLRFPVTPVTQVNPAK